MAEQERWQVCRAQQNLAWANGQTDNVNHPPHYNQAGIECIDAIVRRQTTASNTTCKETSSSTSGDIATRTAYKDLEKARWYLDKLITGDR